MIYELMGRAHTLALRRRLGHELGQGTVEYVGLILLVGVLLAGVVQASGGLADNSIAKAVIGKIKEAIEGVGGGGAPGPAQGA